jgi:hypothetical protein
MAVSEAARTGTIETRSWLLRQPLGRDEGVGVLSSRLNAGRLDVRTGVRTTLRQSGMDSNVQFCALDRQRFRGFVRAGADLPAHRSSEQLPASAYQSICRAAVRGAATHRPDQAASHQGCAVDGASASRNRWFESVPLQRRVSCELNFRRYGRFHLCGAGAAMMARLTQAGRQSCVFGSSHRPTSQTRYGTGSGAPNRSSFGPRPSDRLDAWQKRSRIRLFHRYRRCGCPSIHGSVAQRSALPLQGLSPASDLLPPQA